MSIAFDRQPGGAEMHATRSDQRAARRRWPSRRALVSALVVALGLILLVWAAAPAVRALTLVATSPVRATPNAASAGLPVREVRFSASDGVRLAGWLALRSPDAPTVILVHGFKGS